MPQVKKKAIYNKILEVAQRDIAVLGYDKVSMRKIAAKCNISVSNLYNYFSNKEALLDSLVGEFYYQVLNIEKADISMPSSFNVIDFNEYLISITKQLIEFMNSNQDILRILLSKVKGSKYEDFRDRLIDNYCLYELKSVSQITAKYEITYLPSETLIKNLYYMYANLCETYLLEKKEIEWIHEKMDELNRFVIGGLRDYIK